MRLLLVLVLLLSGCRYPIDPRTIEKISASTEPGNTCIDPKTQVGGRIQNLETGQLGTVMQIYGPSPRCADPGHPNLADVMF